MKEHLDISTVSIEIYLGLEAREVINGGCLRYLLCFCFSQVWGRKGRKGLLLLLLRKKEVGAQRPRGTDSIANGPIGEPAEIIEITDCIKINAFSTNKLNKMGKKPRAKMSKLER